ncbi:MAG: S8 family serine peptidase, partial [bacterium]
MSKYDIRDNRTTCIQRLVLFLATFIVLLLTENLPAQDAFENNAILLKLSSTAAASLDLQLVEGVVETNLASLDALNRQHKAIRMQRIFRPAGKYEAAHISKELHQYYKLRFGEEVDILAVVQLYAQDENVEIAQPNWLYRILNEFPRQTTPLSCQPDDPVFLEQWNLNNTGQTGGSPDSDIDAPEAWCLETGKPDVVVSILDTGLDLDHPELQENMWTNPGEIPANGIDDDNNGYIDDVNGWDFSDNDNDPDDDNDHGTHGAGIIAVRSNNDEMIAGIAGGWGADAGVSLMACKIFPNALVAVIIEAFVYAADNGARVSNNAWGTLCPASEIIENAIDYFIATSDGVVLFAAGAENSSDPCHGYPASYPPVVAVAATDHKDEKAPFSNYGDWVDVSAPGVNIWSTVIDGYQTWNGTSPACAHASGVAALLFSANPNWTGAQVRVQLLAGTDNIDAMNPGFEGLLGTGRVNAYKALSDGPLPNPPANLQGTVAGNDVDLTWVDPTQNTDGSPINLDHITVYRDGTEITQVSGGVESYADLGVSDGQHSYFVTATNVEGFESSPSNIENVLVGTFDVLIWVPQGVSSADEMVERAAQVKGQTLTVEEAQAILDAKVQSHSEIEAALTAIGIASLTTQDINAFDLSDFMHVFVVLGQFPANFVIQAGSAEAAAIEGYIADGGKVYMEGGDVWFYDPQNAGGHDFGPTFGIAVVDDGAAGGEFNRILGESILIEGLDFDYNVGTDNFPDHIEPTGTGFLFHSNEAPAFDCGVANPCCLGPGFTIGTSFEFGQLVDGAPLATKVALMDSYISFFCCVTDPAPHISVEPPSWDYGETLIGAGLDKVFLVKNHELAFLPLEVDGTEIVGPDASEFSIVSGGAPFTVESGESHEVIVRFQPTSIGSKSATFRITSNAANGNPFDVPLSGNAMPSPEWLVPITVCPVEGVSTDLSELPCCDLAIGGHQDGTDGFDLGLDIPAPPPGFTYYCALAINGLPSFLSTDIRGWISPFDVEKVWTLIVINADGITSEVSWDNSQLPPEGSFFLEENSHGLNVDMR